MTSRKIKVLFFGAVEFSENLLRTAIESEFVEVVGVVTKKESKINSDFKDLSPIAKKYGISYFLAEKNNQKEILDWAKNLSFDYIYCFGWSYLIHESILNTARHGGIGYHPAELPKNRGRHPIIWALALGLSKTASTFFKMEKVADSGDIYSQKSIQISYSDDALSLYRKLNDVAVGQVREMSRQLALGELVPSEQENEEANEWRKRGKSDGEIDFRMSSISIYNLVRALTRPYVGSHYRYKETDCKVWKVREEREVCPKNIEPGKVLNKVDNSLLVKCGDYSIWLEEHDLPNEVTIGDYL